MSVEIKKKDDNNFLMIIYNENNYSIGNNITKNDLYDLYIQLREIFKKENK